MLGGGPTGTTWVGHIEGREGGIVGGVGYKGTSGDTNASAGREGGTHANASKRNEGRAAGCANAVRGVGVETLDAIAVVGGMAKGPDKGNEANEGRGNIPMAVDVIDPDVTEAEGDTTSRAEG